MAFQIQSMTVTTSEVRTIENAQFQKFMIVPRNKHMLDAKKVPPFNLLACQFTLACTTNVQLNHIMLAS
jgi:hypothetical protein